MKTCMNILLGSYDVGHLLQYFALSTVGIIISLLLDSTTRDPRKSGSPEKFSWRFFIKDNIVRLLLTLIIVYLLIRFGRESLEGLGVPLSVVQSDFLYVLLGVFSDVLIVKIRKLKKAKERGLLKK